MRRGDVASNGGDARESFFRDDNEVREASIHPRSKQPHVRAHVGAPTRAGSAVSAGNLRSESDLRARGGNVDPRGEIASDAPHACCDFVPEDHARGDAVRLLSRRDAQVRPAQRCCFHGQENVAWAKCWDGAFLEHQGAGGVKRRCEHGIHAPSIGLVPIAGGAPFIPSTRAIEHAHHHCRTYVLYNG